MGIHGRSERKLCDGGACGRRTPSWRRREGLLFIAIDAGCLAWLGLAVERFSLGSVARCSTVVLRDFIFDEPRSLSSSQTQAALPYFLGRIRWRGLPRGAAMYSIILVLCSAVKASSTVLDLRLSISSASLDSSKGDGRCPCAELRDTGALSVDQSPSSA